MFNTFVLMNYNSTLIALAWPDTKVVKEGKWYDYPMQFLGFIKDGYYTAGHAAFLLINHDDGNVEYFDFGRYHTPYQYGRVRDRITDPDLEVNIKAIIEDGEILNIKEILLYIKNNEACHGVGKLTAVLTECTNFNKTYNRAKQIQDYDAIPYGPFKINGSTCSRFVAKITYTSTSNWLTKLLIMLPYTVSATPRSNRKTLNEKPYYYEINKGTLNVYKNKWYFVKRWFIYKKSYPIPQTA